MQTNTHEVRDLRELVEAKNWDTINNNQANWSLSDYVTVMGEVSNEDRIILFRLLEKERALDVFERLDFNDQSDLVGVFTDPEAIQILEELDPDLRAHLFEEMPAKVTKRMLAALSPEARDMVNVLLGYPEETAGRVMSPRYLAVRDSVTVGAALATVRGSEIEDDELRAIFVIDDKRIYQGFVRVVQLVRAEADTSIRELIVRPDAFVRATDSELEAARLLKLYDVVALPVLDNENRMVGVITFDDVIDLLEEEASETMYRKAGVADIAGDKDVIYSQRLTQGSIWYPVRARIVFLLVTVVGGFAVGGLIDNFEEVLESVLIAAIFIPLVMDMGGNVGTQSTTIFARGLALGHINLSRFRYHLFREVRTGLVIGALLGLLAGILALVWQGIPNDIPQIGIAVGISVFSVITFASFLGFFLPWVMVKIGVDHAPGADPFITTIKDFTGLSIYFLLVNALIMA